MKSGIRRQSDNKLLNALQPDAFERVTKRLARVKLRPKQVVYKPYEAIDLKLPQMDGWEVLERLKGDAA